MIKQYLKSDDQKLSEHFKSNEFDCHCKYPDCKITYIDTDLIDYLEEKRHMIGRTIHIDSGFRCVQHNRDVLGKIGSIHLIGKAADISMPIGDILDYKDFFKDADGLGIYRTKHFIHVDVRGYRTRWEG